MALRGEVVPLGSVLLRLRKSHDDSSARRRALDVNARLLSANRIDLLAQASQKITDALSV